MPNQNQNQTLNSNEIMEIERNKIMRINPTYNQVSDRGFIQDL